MHDAHELLRTLTIVLGTAALTTVLFQRIKQPVVLGYLVAGMLVGPHVPFPLAADMDATRTLSELGVILLMFSLGLEFSLRSLLRVGPRSAVIAIVECSLMIWLGHLVAELFGWSPREALYTGGIVAISSTTIIVKAFAENAVRGKFKETVFGVLIVEDLIAILLLTTLTAISSGTSVSVGSLASTAARLGAFLAALLVAGMLVVPRLVRLTLRFDRPEITVVVAAGVCFFSAWLAQSFGYSVALGAFVAGSLISESGEAKRVEHAILPVRDLFGAIFFVSVGMLIDPRLIAQRWDAALALTFTVVLGKLTFVTLGSLLTGAGIRPSLQAGMSQAQIGEFSFIIAGLGLALGATRDFLYPVAVAVSALTTLTTPWLIRAASPVAAWVDGALPAPLQTFLSLYASWIERLGKRSADAERARRRRVALVLLADAAVLAVIAFGAPAATERLVASLRSYTSLSVPVLRVASALLCAVLAAPFVIGAIRNTRHLGLLLATESMPPSPGEKLDLAEVPRRSMVVALQLAIVIVLGAPLLAVSEPFLPPLYGALVFGLLVLVLAVRFWRTATDLQGHMTAAAQVIAEALSRHARTPSATSKPVGTDAPVNTPSSGAATSTSDAATPPDSPSATDPMTDLQTHLPGAGSIVAYRIPEGAFAAGKTLAALDLRGLTGATVLAMKSPAGETSVPSPKTPLEQGTTLALSGSDEAIAAALELLEKGP